MNIYKRFNLAGLSHSNKDTLKELREDQALKLVARPDNPYDSNAVEVMTADGKVPIGWIAKKDNLLLSHELRNHPERCFPTRISRINEFKPQQYFIEIEVYLV